MSVYSDIPKEETFKAAVFRDFFNKTQYAYEPNIDNIDFIVTETKTLKGSLWARHYLWAESKKGVADIPSMLTQLVLTIKKTYEKAVHLPPPYIACFDTVKIAFVPFHDILVNARDNFESNFMTDFIAGNIKEAASADLFTETKPAKRKALKFSKEAKAVFKTAQKLWTYYLSQASSNVNASLYDIREFFQGRDDTGRMNNKSGDDTYTELNTSLRVNLKLLAEKIKPKVYEYGFLVK